MYRTLALTILAACSLSACSATRPVDRLRNQLTQTAAEGRVIFGHHDDTAYGHTWKYEPGRSDVLEVTGMRPALINWDLGLIEHNAPAQLDGVPFEFIRAEIAAQDARGGISALSWHPENPVSGGNSWDVSTEPLRLMEGDKALSDTLTAWIGRAADFIGSLRDANGRRIPVIFRPWHELTGSWFWWGRDHADPGQYRALWRLTREVFDAKGIDNVLWAYSPDRLDSYEAYIERYPGDEYVDIMGADCYQFNGADGTQGYISDVHGALGSAAEAAVKHGKILAFTETGIEGIPVADWYTSVLLPLLKEYPVAYVCVWRNAHDNPRHFYTPYPGHPAADDFKSFANNKSMVFLH